MAKKKTKKKAVRKEVAALTHEDAARKNIPTAEFQSVMDKDDQQPVEVRYERDTGGQDDPIASEKESRNRDLDPQLVWRGKDQQDWSDLVVQAPPLFIQEKVHPKALIDQLTRESRKRAEAEEQAAEEAEAPSLFADLFADFNGLPDDDAKTEFYEHDANWTNRMILGDSLQVMASLAEREGLRGNVQCIYFDPPYGIKFNSNFQWSTTSRDVKDGKAAHITREPEQVKAFRDTWRDGIHSYLTYLRDRLAVGRDLLNDTGSIFVQIGDENVHRVKALMDEVFGEENRIAQIGFVKTAGLASSFLASRCDYLLWYGKRRDRTKFRQPYFFKSFEDGSAATYRWIRDARGDFRSLSKHEDPLKDCPDEYRLYKASDITSQGNPPVPFEFNGRKYSPKAKTNHDGLCRLQKSGRIHQARNSIQYVRYLDDYIVSPISELWTDTATGSFTDEKVYIVQTGTKTVQRCLLMATDPGDLVVDPTCGSGTTAYVAEQWGRRWITVDTSRVSLALARARVMGARFPFYVLSDSQEGVETEARLSRTELPPNYERQHYGQNVRQGFVYERVPHITLKTIAHNSEIDSLTEKYATTLVPLLEKLGSLVPAEWLADYRKGVNYDTRVPSTIQEWEVPQVIPESWPIECQLLLDEFWEIRIARQKEIDASIAAKADFEYLYDKPYEDKKKVRVAGPFTVESISPHRTLGVDEDDELIDPLKPSAEHENGEDAAGFVDMVLANLKTAGVQQAHKEDKIEFSSIAPWPGHFICAEARVLEWGEDSGEEKRAGIFIGPEFGTVGRQDLVAAAREAGDADFDLLIACAFNFEAHASEFSKLGRIPVLKARMNADLHMADDLKNTGKGNLFVIFGEPDIDIEDADGGKIQVKINGVDVFHPATGEVRSDGAEGIACWFIDTDYNEESFFVRHAYFLGQNDPYKSLKTTLKAEIDEEAWASLNRDVSRPFKKPESGRIAVKVINHLGDEVMKVFRVE